MYSTVSGLKVTGQQDPQNADVELGEIPSPRYREWLKEKRKWEKSIKKPYNYDEYWEEVYEWRYPSTWKSYFKKQLIRLGLWCRSNYPCCCCVHRLVSDHYERYS